MKENIIAFILENTKDLTRGNWMRDRGAGLYDVGIGGYSGNPGMADNNYHIEVKDGELVVLNNWTLDKTACKKTHAVLSK